MIIRGFFTLTTLLFLSFLSLNFISASCNSGQIDINTASSGELDKLSGIGPVKAQAIIDSRPFNSVDDLINVNGIGNVTLNNIKSQGLACVSEEETEEDKDSNVKENTNSSSSLEFSNNNPSPKNIELRAISLNPQAIKSEENSQFSGKGNYAIYSLIAFGILLGLLFLIKKKKNKNEFE